MLIIRVDEGEALPLARSGYCRVLVEEWNSHGIRHVVFIPAEATRRCTEAIATLLPLSTTFARLHPAWQ